MMQKKKKMRGTFAQMAYDHRKMNKRFLRIQKSLDEINVILNCKNKKK